MADVEATVVERLLEQVQRCAVSLRELEEYREDGGRVTLSQLAILQLLQQEGMLTVPQLGRRRGCARQTVQVVADRLAAVGLVAYIANPDHHRSELLQLTASGRRLAMSARRRRAHRLTQVAGEIRDEELRICQAVLEKIRLHLDGNGRFGVPPLTGRRARQRPIGGMELSDTADKPGSAMPEPGVERESEPELESEADSELESDGLPVNLL